MYFVCMNESTIFTLLLVPTHSWEKHLSLWLLASTHQLVDNFSFPHNCPSGAPIFEKSAIKEPSRVPSKVPLSAGWCPATYCWCPFHFFFHPCSSNILSAPLPAGSFWSWNASVSLFWIIKVHTLRTPDENMSPVRWCNQCNHVSFLCVQRDDWRAD